MATDRVGPRRQILRRRKSRPLIGRTNPIAREPFLTRLGSRPKPFKPPRKAGNGAALTFLSPFGGAVDSRDRFGLFIVASS